MRLALRRWVPGWSPAAYAVAAAVAVGGVGAACTLAGVEQAVVGALTLVFLAIAPGAAAVALVDGDRIARTVVAVSGAIVVNAVVAQTMLLLGMWSPRGGVAAVGAVSAAIFAVGRVRTRGTASGAGHGRPSR